MNKPTTHTEVMFCRQAIERFVNYFFIQYRPNERSKALDSINVLKSISKEIDDIHPLAKFREYLALTVAEILADLYLSGNIDLIHSIGIDIFTEDDVMDVSVNVMGEAPGQEAA